VLFNSAKISHSAQAGAQTGRGAKNQALVARAETF